MNLEKWALKWGVSFDALDDLRKQMGSVSNDLKSISSESESAVQTNIRLEASRKHVHLWRNNVGAVTTDSGGYLRYGLANDSKRLNKVIKSSDLIGIRPITIMPNDVGHIIGQFVAREVKAGDWRYTGTTREQAQLRFLELITANGGDAAFANSEGSL